MKNIFIKLFAVLAIGWGIGFLPGTANAHTTKLNFEVATDGSGNVTFYAASYQVFSTTTTNSGGIIIDGVTYNFTGITDPLPFVPPADGSKGMIAFCPNAFRPDESLVAWQTVTVSSLSSGNHSITTTVTGTTIEDPWAFCFPQTFNIITNISPVANAGTDQTILIGNTVTLDGSVSSDADSDPLTFSWSLTTRPTGSAATLSDPAAVGPTFFVDLPGTYVAQLIVNDGTVDSTADTVNVFGNTPPTCNGNPSGLALVGMAIDTPIQFSVEGIDPDGDLLRVTSTPLPGVPPNLATLTPVAGTTQASPFTANFDWTPAAVDPETVTITMDDRRGGSCSQTFIITPEFRGFVSAFGRELCSNFKRGGSAQFLFDEFGKIRDLLTDVIFFDLFKCEGDGRPGVSSDPGNVICSQSQFSPGLCARGTKNSPYILKMFINGVGAVSTCYDFDGLPADCNLGGGATCIDSSQCTSGECSGSAETPGTCQ